MVDVVGDHKAFLAHNSTFDGAVEVTKGQFHVMTTVQETPDRLHELFENRLAASVSDMLIPIPLSHKEAGTGSGSDTAR
jgi:hypothetical protein